MAPTLHWITHADQRLSLCPGVGGSVAAWQWLRDGQVEDLWRPWTGTDGDPASPSDMASFPLVPWSNRIGGGGFTHDGSFYALQPNQAGEPYPIHGDGWLQAWEWHPSNPDTALMTLTSRHHRGGPHHYRATQRFQLEPGAMRQTLTVQNLGPQALPFGLGAHPWFTRTPRCSVQARVGGLWLAGADKLPTGHTTDFPPGWDLNLGVLPDAVVIDNAYADWRGQARLHWPERDLVLTLDATLRVPGAASRLDLVLYTPANSGIFCLEPVSHPVNAAHLPGQPGWTVLQPGESMALDLRWGIHDGHAGSRQCFR